MNLPALFQGGNEIRRLEETSLWILPPGQGLHAAESAGHGAHNGLIIGFDVSLFHRFIHMTGYIILQLHLPVQGLRVVSHEPVAAVMDAVAGNLDPSYRQIGVCPPAAQLVNACLAVHLGRRAEGQDAAVGFPDFILHASAVCQYHEMVHIKAGNEMPWKDLFQTVPDLTKKSVPFRYAVGYIEKLEMDNVKEQKGILFGMAPFAYHLFRVRQKLTHPGKSGNMVLFIHRQFFIHRRHKNKDQVLSLFPLAPAALHIHLPLASVSESHRGNQVEPPAGRLHLPFHILLHQDCVLLQEPGELSAGESGKVLFITAAKDALQFLISKYNFLFLIVTVYHDAAGKMVAHRLHEPGPVFFPIFHSILTASIFSRKWP